MTTHAGLRTRLSLEAAWVPPAAVAVGAAMACLVLSAFDPGKESFYPRCPFRALTGRACPGCGITRGLHELLRGHPVAALHLNLLLVGIVPATLYGYAAWALPRLWGPNLPTFTLTRRKIVGGIAVLLLFMFLRNLPWEPFRSFSSLN